jgi:streptogramin lyase
MNRTLIAVLLAAVIAVSAVGAYLVLNRGPCDPNSATVTTSKLTGSNFGDVTEYPLPRSHDWANAVTVASDGSVWFGEQALPGVAQFNSAGVLTEYQWSCYSSSSGNGGPLTSIWGVAQWNGMIWGADGDRNQLVGLNPSNGSLKYVNTTSAQFPYLLSPAPDGSLWFTSLGTKPLLGKMAPDLALTVYQVSGLGKQEPIQILFVNATFAYMVALDPLSASGAGGLYSFDPQTSAGTIEATQVGGSFTLFFPDSLSMTGTEIWIAQHSPSNVVEYDTRSGVWTVYPTSIPRFNPPLRTTLPYFVQASSGGVWFNEHYANRIAFIDPLEATMTEYSEANPPVTNASTIGNDLTIALASNGLWFTSATDDYLGFVSGATTNAFHFGALGSNHSLTLSPGGSGKVQLDLGGAWTPLTVQVSDSENASSVPRLITIQPDFSFIQSGSGSLDFSTTISTSSSLAPGRYTVDITVTDGLVYETVFVFLTVT